MMADQKNPSGDYEVGYGKPPKSGQIKKGVFHPAAGAIDFLIEQLGAAG